jgi:hypothetical protein
MSNRVGNSAELAPTATAATSRLKMIHTPLFNNAGEMCFSNLQLASANKGLDLYDYETLGGGERTVVAQVAYDVEDTGTLSICTYRGIGSSALSKQKIKEKIQVEDPRTPGRYLERHNVIELPANSGEYGMFLQIGAALAIMHSGGKTGEQRPPLYPAREERSLARVYSNSSASAYVVSDGTTERLTVAVATHCRPHTTTVDAFLALNLDEAEARVSSPNPLPTPETSPDCLSVSMFERLKPGKKAFIGQIAASAAFTLSERNIRHL